jgi:hypothetical protein
MNKLTGDVTPHRRAFAPNSQCFCADIRRFATDSRKFSTRFSRTRNAFAKVLDRGLHRCSAGEVEKNAVKSSPWAAALSARMRTPPGTARVAFELQEAQSAPQRGEIGVQHPFFLARSHPRKHPAGLQRTLLSANVRAMSNEGLGATNRYALCEGCSCEAAELSAAWRPPTSMLPTKLRSSELITQSVHTDPALQSRWAAASQ